MVQAGIERVQVNRNFKSSSIANSIQTDSAKAPISRYALDQGDFVWGIHSILRETRLTKRILSLNRGVAKYNIYIQIKDQR